MKNPFLSLPGAVSILLLGMFLLTGILLIRSAPEVKIVKSVEITRNSDNDFDRVIGWQELGQLKGSRSAEKDHLRIRYEKDRGWEISNAAKHKKVDVRTDLHDTIFLKRRALQTNDIISLGNSQIEVIGAENNILELKEIKTSRTVKWQDGSLNFPENENIYTQYWSIWQKIKQKLRYWFTKVFHIRENKERRIFSLGGGINCQERWRISDAPNPESAYIYQYDNRFFTGPGSTDTPVNISRPGRYSLRFSQIFLPLDGKKGRVNRIVMGRTYYNVEISKDRLQLIPAANTDVHPWETKLPEPRYPEIKIITNQTPVKIDTGKPFFQWIMDHIQGILLIFCISISGILLLFRYQGIRGKDSGLIPPLIFIPLTLLMWITRRELDFSVLLFLIWLAWTWGTVHLIWQNHLIKTAGMLWISALFLAGAGTIILAQLALGADSIRWADFARKHFLILCLSGWTIPIFSLLSPETVSTLWTEFSAGREPVWKWLRIILVSVLLCPLFLQLPFGSEQGLWGLVQPAELAKLLLVFTAAFVGMDISEVRNRNSNDYSSLIWGFLKTLLLVTVALLTVLIGVRDISPVLIMAIFMLAWLWAIAPHPWELSGEKPEKTISRPILRGLVLVIVIFILLTSWKIYHKADDLPYGFPQRDRFQVWSNPAAHPHSGEQVITAMKLAGFGKWTGAAPSFFGSNKDAMNLPMIQNDFIGTFVLYKFGGIWGLILVLIQAVYICLLFESAGQSREWGRKGGYKKQQAGQILYLILLGLAWMHMVQWTIAWGNVLGLLPVMGQPMTWIASANSHMIFFGLPTLGLGMMGGRMA